MVLVRSDDRTYVFGNVPSDYLDHYDPFGVPHVVVVLGSATGASVVKRELLHPDEALDWSKIAA